MSNKIRAVPAEMKDRERQIILWLGDQSCRKVDDEGFTPWASLIERSEDEGFMIFDFWDQLRYRWGAVQMPEGTEQPRWCLTYTGNQYYELLKAEMIAKTAEAPSPTARPEDEKLPKEAKGAGRSPGPKSRSGK